MMHDNLQMIVNLYRAVERVCPQTKVIHPLSNCSYPGDSVRQCESQWLDGPVHPSVLAYGPHRRMIYELAECYRQQYGIRTVTWLVPNAYGPGDATDPDKVHALNGIIIRLILAQRAGAESFEIWGSGTPIREWGYVEDIARILLDSLELEERVYPLNLAQNRGWSILEIAAMAARLLQFPVRFTLNTRLPDERRSRCSTIVNSAAAIRTLSSLRWKRAFAARSIIFARSPIRPRHWRAPLSSRGRRNGNVKRQCKFDLSANKLKRRVR